MFNDQRPIKSQCSMPKAVASLGALGIGAWSFFGPWTLIIGHSSALVYRWICGRVFPDVMPTLSRSELWYRFQKYYTEFPTLGLAIDLSRMNFSDDYLASMSTPIQRALIAMA